MWVWDIIRDGCWSGWGNDLLQSGIVTGPAGQRDSPHSAPGADVTSPGLMMEQWHRHIFSLLFDWSHCQSDFFLCFHALAPDDSDYIEDFNDKIGDYISQVAARRRGTCEHLNMLTPPNINANIVKYKRLCCPRELLPTKDWLTDNWPIEIGGAGWGHVEWENTEQRHGRPCLHHIHWVY